MEKNFSSPNFSRGLHQLAQTRPTGAANKFVHQGLRGVSLERNHRYIYLKSQYFIVLFSEGAGWTGSGLKTADSTSWKTGERKHTRQSQAEGTAGCCEKAWERQEILNLSMSLLTAKIYQIDRSFFASYGTHAMNYFASLEIFMRQGRRTQR